MDELVDAIKTALTSALGSSYTYLYGENPIPRKSDLPLIEIDPLITEFNVRGTGGLRTNVYRVAIRLKLSMYDYLSNDTDVTVQSHKQDLVQIMEARNVTTKQPDTGTILYILHNDLEVSDTVQITDNFIITYTQEIAADGSMIRVAALELEAQEITPC